MASESCPKCMSPRTELVARMGDEEQWRCRMCGHSWTMMDDPDGEFTGMF